MFWVQYDAVREAHQEIERRAQAGCQPRSEARQRWWMRWSWLGRTRRAQAECAPRSETAHAK